MEKLLCDLCHPKQWKTISSSMLQSAGYPVYGANGIIGYYSEYNHSSETLLITCRGATCGALNICKPFSYVNGNAMALDDLSSEVDLHYLYYYLSARGLSDVITGSAQPQIVRQSLNKVRIVYPSLAEQRHIAAVLNKVTDLIAQRRAQLDKLDLLVKSRFVEMFEQGNYPKVKTSEICDFITKGTTPPSDEIFKEDSPTRIPFLKVYNLSFTGELLFEQNPQYIERNIHEGQLSRSKVYPNDVLMNIVGPPLGKFSLIPENYETLNINQAIAIFRAKEKILPRFLLAALMQPEVLKPFMDQAVGVRQQNLSLEQCRNLEISLPNIELQKQFVKFAEQVEKSKLTIQKSLGKLETMKNALMQEYFK